MRKVLIPLVACCVAIATHAQPSQNRALRFSPPPNDMFTNAQVQTGYGWYAGGQTRGATHEKGDGGKATVWYSWTAPASGPTLMSIWDQKKPLGSFNVLTGTNVTTLKAVKPIKRNRLNFLFSAQMGTTYYFDVNKPGGIQPDNIVDFTLQLTLTTVAITQPTNNSFFSKSTDPVPLSMITTEDPSMVQSVKFLASGMPIAEVDSPPYAATWTNALPGNWQIYAELTRTDGYVLDTAKVGVSIRPYNDNFADRKILVGTNINISEPGDNATLEPGEPAVNQNGSVWYSWTAPGNGFVLIPHYYGAFVVPINVFSGDALTTLTQIKTTDNAGNDVPFPVTAGEQINVAIFSGVLSLTYYPVPENDNFASATEMSGTNGVLSGSNLAATPEPGEPIADGAQGHSVWFTWTPPTNGMIILNETNGPVIFTDQYNGLEVTTFTGDDVTNLTAVSTNVLGPSYISVLGGTTYHFAVDATRTNVGLSSFGIEWSFVPAPANDGFANRAVLTGDDVTLYYSSLGASTEPGEPDHGQNSLWWTWTAPYTGTALVTGALYSPARGHAYTGNSLTSLALVGSDDQGYFLWHVDAGTTYQIAVTDWSPTFLEAAFRLHYYTNGTPIDP